MANPRGGMYGCVRWKGRKSKRYNLITIDVVRVPELASPRIQTRKSFMSPSALQRYTHSHKRPLRLALLCHQGAAPSRRHPRACVVEHSPANSFPSLSGCPSPPPPPSTSTSTKPDHDTPVETQTHPQYFTRRVDSRSQCREETCNL